MLKLTHQMHPHTPTHTHTHSHAHTHTHVSTHTRIIMNTRARHTNKHPHHKKVITHLLPKKQSIPWCQLSRAWQHFLHSYSECVLQSCPALRQCRPPQWKGQCQPKNGKTHFSITTMPWHDTLVLELYQCIWIYIFTSSKELNFTLFGMTCQSSYHKTEMT